MKKNIKVIIGTLVGIVIGVASGIGVYATLTYSSGDISYTKSGSSTPISVESALNELYAIKKDYIKPSGTKNITTKANNIDVSNFKYADTTGMYTADEYNAKTGEGTYWKSGQFTSVSGENSINIGFIPNKIVLIRGDSGSTILYDNRISTSTYWIFGSTLHEQRSISTSNTSSLGFKTINSVTKIHINNAGGIFYWYATK